jgi:hypothetical protein
LSWLVNHSSCSMASLNHFETTALLWQQFNLMPMSTSMKETRGKKKCPIHGKLVSMIT